MPLSSAALLADLRHHRPLVHNITNYVVMNLTANALLAVGASPVMAHAEGEIEDMVALANSVVINIGTLSDRWIVAMKKAAIAAAHNQTPYVLDPVGAGATQLRTQTAKEILNQSSPAVIRGNASEICALAHETVKTLGVDSSLDSDQAIDAARLLAEQYRTAVVVSGKVDHIVDAQQHVEIHNGDRIMTQVTGMGCTATALIGAFVATAASPFDAVVVAMSVMGVAGELAAQQAQGPGTFVPHFLDALAALTPADLDARAQVIHR
ncbi:hydroxyethylthiazole kinase [Oscillatoria sp. CS-180]|uniref:hydroxyethylthiazole kinase n=1 Tax=Oscillatoria sp. CS-180 TaxID=3021720 RepID=UPI00232AA8D8|nr:hydroxyethylthiazole kinase [Oscillatoria sp. CS-180]MDB9529005.1 hydroxyethylthiazole kinase [Oscillatoria sp. CS-180]